MRETPESPRMFESDFFDAFSRIPWVVVPILYLPISTALFGWGILEYDLPLVASLLVAFAGVLAWTFSEYWFHRTLFHWVPNARWGPRMHFILHGVHHTWPKDRYRLVMPPAVSLMLLVFFFLVFELLLGPTWMLPFYGGYVFGYMLYDCSHYAVHHLRVPGKSFARLKAHHMAHHFNERYADRKFGVSTTLWDHVFRTY